MQLSANFAEKYDKAINDSVAVLTSKDSSVLLNCLIKFLTKIVAKLFIILLLSFKKARNKLFQSTLFQFAGLTNLKTADIIFVKSEELKFASTLSDIYLELNYLPVFSRLTQ